MHTSRHTYSVTTVWDAGAAGPARTYDGYSRDHLIKVEGKPDLAGSSDPAFRGDAARHNPEDLLVASLSACHMLWYLHLCTQNEISVFSYTDRASGMMEVAADGGGQFSQVVLRPCVRISPATKTDLATALHAKAHSKCFIANSVNFPVTCEPEITVEN